MLGWITVTQGKTLNLGQVDYVSLSYLPNKQLGLLDWLEPTEGLGERRHLQGTWDPYALAVLPTSCISAALG